MSGNKARFSLGEPSNNGNIAVYAANIGAALDGMSADVKGMIQSLKAILAERQRQAARDLEPPAAISPVQRNSPR